MYIDHKSEGIMLENDRKYRGCDVSIVNPRPVVFKKTKPNRTISALRGWRKNCKRISAYWPLLPVVRYDASETFDKGLDLSQRGLLLFPFERLPFRTIDLHD